MTDIFFIQTPASGLLIPFLFVLADIISEVYGFNIIKRLINDALVCQMLLGIIVSFAVFLLPGSKQIYLNLAYCETFRNLLWTNFTSLFSVSSGMYANSFMMAKFKFNMHGRRAVFRILISSGISELVLCTVAYFILFFGIKTINETFYIIAIMWIYKMIFTILTSCWVAQIANKIKKSEQSDVYDDLSKTSKIIF